MNLEQFFSQSYPQAPDQWEKALKAELKTDDVAGKTLKKSPEGKSRTLSLGAPRTHQLRSLEPWKKAAQTYVRLPTNWEGALQDDLAAGVRLFFFEKEFLTQEHWTRICRNLSAFPKANEIVVVLTGDGDLQTPTPKFKLIDEKDIICGREAWALGGTIVQELSQIAIRLTDARITPEVYLGVFLDSHFFRNIAKVRAARLLAQKILNERKLSSKVFIVGLTSYREWTLYERYSNLLRNDVSVASGLIAGCDFVQSAGYQVVFDLETEILSSKHDERSRRMARNTSHILALESMLGLVEDPSSGSYHLETLSEDYARGSWELMQRALPLGAEEVSRLYLQETATVRDERIKNVSIRREVLAGLNDFPDVRDELKLPALPRERFFRTGRIFEELRLRMETAVVKPDVYLAIFGDYSALNARINFVKNYFELLGLPVIDPGRAVTAEEVSERKEKFLVLIAADAHYAEVVTVKSQASERYIAGKSEFTGYQNLFAGQDVHAVLFGIVQRWGKNDEE